MTDHINIGGRRIGADSSVCLVAEMSANHNQDFGQAQGIIEAAKESGADAVKVQAYRPDTLTIDSRKPPFLIDGGTLWDGRSLYELYKEAYIPWDWLPKLKQMTEDLGMAFFSTAFDDSSVDFLEELGVGVHKVASFELVDIPLIEKMASTGKPLIISTGMGTLQEIDEAVGAARAAGAGQLMLLKCTSAYPAPPEEMNLRAIEDLSRRFDCPVGLSDHTLGIVVPVASVALGAVLVEKHFTLSRDVPGPDSAFSLEPPEFKEMAEAIRTSEQALGSLRYGPTECETSSLAFRRSLFVVSPVKAGEPFTKDNVRSIRPADGLAPKHLKDVLARRAARDIDEGTPLGWDLIE